MTDTTCTELYQDLMQNVSDLLCDICVIEALYRCRASLPCFGMRWEKNFAAPGIFLSSTPATPRPAAASCLTVLQRMWA